MLLGRRTDLFLRDPYKVPITDFFGSVRRVEVAGSVVNVTAAAGTVPKEAAGLERPVRAERFEFGDLLPIDTLLRQGRV